MWTRVAFGGEEEITAQGHERRVITPAKILGSNIQEKPTSPLRNAQLLANIQSRFSIRRDLHQTDKKVLAKHATEEFHCRAARGLRSSRHGIHAMAPPSPAWLRNGPRLT